VTSVTGRGKEAPPVTQPIDIRLSFSAEKEHSVGWQARCNGYGANVQFTATVMEVDQSGGTLIGCEPEIEKEDAWLANFMEADPEWRLEGEQLQLTSDDATIELKGASDEQG
jgi:heat shock protein HslJ